VVAVPRGLALNYFHSVAPSLARHRRILLTCALFLLVGTPAALNIKSWPTRLQYPGDLSAIEGVCLAETSHFRQGIPVYAPASAERFNAMIYGPLYYLLASRLVNTERPTYFPLRFLGLVATLGMAAGCTLLAFWLTGSRAASLFAFLFYFSWSIVSDYGLTARCDMTALLLDYWGLLLAYRFRGSLRIVWVAPLMLLAIFYKQQFVAAPLAVFAFLLLEKRYRDAGRFASLMAAGGLTLLAVFQFIVFAGQDFFLHFVSYNITHFSWGRFGAGLLVATVFFSIPCLLAFRFLRLSPHRLLEFYLILAVALSVAAFGKEGSGLNYFLEPVAILAPLVGAGVLRASREGRRMAGVAALLGISLLPITRLGEAVPKAEDFARDRAIQAYIHANFKPGTEGASFFTGRLLRAGLATPISDFYQYTWLACTGKIPEGDWVAQLESQRFGVILLSTDLRDEKFAHLGTEICLSEPVHRVFLRNYELKGVLDLPVPESRPFRKRLFVWVPKGRARDRGA
jgi:hypothetical protein